MLAVEHDGSLAPPEPDRRAVQRPARAPRLRLHPRPSADRVVDAAGWTPWNDPYQDRFTAAGGHAGRVLAGRPRRLRRPLRRGRSTASPTPTRRPPSRPRRRCSDRSCVTSAAPRRSTTTSRSARSCRWCRRRPPRSTPTGRYGPAADRPVLPGAGTGRRRPRRRPGTCMGEPGRRVPADRRRSSRGGRRSPRSPRPRRHSSRLPADDLPPAPAWIDLSTPPTPRRMPASAPSDDRLGDELFAPAARATARARPGRRPGRDRAPDADLPAGRDVAADHGRPGRRPRHDQRRARPGAAARQRHRRGRSPGRRPKVAARVAVAASPTRSRSTSPARTRPRCSDSGLPDRPPGRHSGRGDPAQPALAEPPHAARRRRRRPRQPVGPYRPRRVEATTVRRTAVAGSPRRRAYGTGSAELGGVQALLARRQVRLDAGSPCAARHPGPSLPVVAREHPAASVPVMRYASRKRRAAGDGLVLLQAGQRRGRRHHGAGRGRASGHDLARRRLGPRRPRGRRHALVRAAAVAARRRTRPGLVTMSHED